MFGKFGPVKEVRVALDSGTGRSKGFAFVTMEARADAEAAVAELNGLELDGRPIKVEFAKGPGEKKDRSNVCYEWQRGDCTRGDACRFDHKEDGPSRRDDVRTLA